MGSYSGTTDNMKSLPVVLQRSCYRGNREETDRDIFKILNF